MSDISDLFGLIVVGGIVWFTLPYVTGGSIGGATGSHIYRTTGKTCRGVSETQGISCGGSSATSKRVNFNSCGLLNYELTAKIRFGGGCSSACGDEATLKHLGPPHDDGNCCWDLSAVMQDGSTCFGGEGPHPNTQKCQKKLGGLGSLQGKTVAIKSIIWRISNGWHRELWVDKTGVGTRWAKMGERNISSWGNNETTNRVAAKGGPQQIELRCDCSGASWISWDVAEISIPLAGRYTKAEGTGIEPPLIPVAQVPKIEELERVLDYNTQIVPPSPLLEKPVIIESYLTKRRHKLAGLY